MTKKIKTNIKEDVKEANEEEYDSLSFEEYDDEENIEEYVSNKNTNKKNVRDNKNEDKGMTINIDYNKYKYMIIATLIISAITLLVSVAILNKIENINGATTKEKEGNTKEESVSYDTSMFEEIDIDEFIELFNNKKKYYFVYTGRPTCSYCQKMIGNYQKSVDEYDYELYYYDTQDVTSEIINKVKDLDETFEEDFPATPMVYLVGKGEVKDVSEGYTEYDTYVKFLEDNGVEKK